MTDGGVAGRCVRAMSMSLLLWAPVWANAAALQPGFYEIKTETLMPHLEDNLHYADTREQRCLDGDTPAALFPILRHRSFHGCKLGAGNGSDPVYYPLVCHSSQAPTGTAQLRATQARVSGMLEIQMGGKNMTFSQHIEATRLGACGRSRN